MRLAFAPCGRHAPVWVTVCRPFQSDVASLGRASRLWSRDTVQARRVQIECFVGCMFPLAYAEVMQDRGCAKPTRTTVHGGDG